MLTPLQEYVSQKGYATIGEELGINAYEHPSLPLVGFKYSQIDSPKTNEVVRWSRGTVLEKGTWKLVAQPFKRFFNYGENTDEMKLFDWSDVSVTSKEDGSLMILYFYAGEWQLNTSGSFAFGQYDPYTAETWRDLFWKTFAASGGKKEELNANYTYILELCTIQNKVIRLYPQGRVYMLSTFDGPIEQAWATTASEAARVGVPTAISYNFKSIEQVEDFLMEQEKKDPTFEGVVIRDKNNVRFKVKSKTYLSLHHLHDNGNVARTDRLVQLALSNEGDELLVYLPELKDKFNEIKVILKQEFADLQVVWEANRNISEQKAFAMKVKDHKFSALLFAMKKKPEEMRTEHEFRKLWNDACDLILRKVFPKEQAALAKADKEFKAK